MSKDEPILNFANVISNLDTIMRDILDCFENIGKSEPQVIEDTYFKKVGEFSSKIKLLLKTYFENNREEQLKYKPDILYYRQVQGYLVFILRFPDILKVKDHDEIQQTRKFLENKEYLIRTIYNQLAEHETNLFEGNFRNILEEKLKYMTRIWKVDN